MKATRDKKNRGQTTVEYVLALGIFTILLFGLVQIIIVLTSFNVASYASFMAARSELVYGQKKLEDIGYPLGNLTDASITSKQQTIAEATAERIIVESLPWEAWRLSKTNRHIIKDGIDDGSNTISGHGSISIEYLATGGVALTYCVPTVYRGLPFFDEKQQGCQDSRYHLSGYPITITTKLENN